MTIRTPSSPDMNVCPEPEQSRAPDALCALVRLLAQHAAEDTIKRVRADNWHARKPCPPTLEQQTMSDHSQSSKPVRLLTPQETAAFLSVSGSGESG